MTFGNVSLTMPDPDRPTIIVSLSSCPVLSTRLQGHTAIRIHALLFNPYKHPL